MRQYTRDFEPVAEESFDDSWECELTGVSKVSHQIFVVFTTIVQSHFAEAHFFSASLLPYVPILLNAFYELNFITILSFYEFQIDTLL